MEQLAVCQELQRRRSFRLDAPDEQTLPRKTDRFRSVCLRMSTGLCVFLFMISLQSKNLNNASVCVDTSCVCYKLTDGAQRKRRSQGLCLCLIV